MTFGQRFMLTLAIVLALLFALALFGYLSGRWSEAEAQVELYAGDVPMDARLLQLDREALDSAYKSHLSRLFDVWLSDQAKDMSRVSNGLRHARRAYGVASDQIAKRQQQLEQRK